MLEFEEKQLNTLENKKILKFDIILFLTVIALSCFGLLIIYSATRYSLPGGVTDPAYFLKKQAYWVAAGFIIFWVMQLIDYRKYRNWWVAIFILNLALLGVVLAFGYEVHGSKSWIDLGFSSFQASEISKVLMVLAVAAVFSRRKSEKENRVGFKKVMLSVVVALSCIGMVMLQNDLGTALIFFLTYAGMLFISGANLLYFIGLLGASAGGIAMGVSTGIIKEYQLNRILVFIKPDIQTGGVGYNLYQSKLAIGSGEIWGKGLFLGKQTNLSYVPEHQTDFIFSVIGEEMGFVGGFLVIIALGVAVWRCLTVAHHATDHFGRLIASGVAFILLSQILINIGMTMGIMPIIGIPLPFLSYGGSNLVSLFIGIALVENVYMRRELRKYHQIAYEEFD
ncbi:MAG: rod shape-determining protein RodA [Actinomycetota bacterium]|nr:rod shape-determining protein RodA [Actinomycetota bacterium]